MSFSSLSLQHISICVCTCRYKHINRTYCLHFCCCIWILGWLLCIRQPTRGFSFERSKSSFFKLSTLDNKFIFQGRNTVKDFFFYINMSTGIIIIPVFYAAVFRRDFAQKTSSLFWLLHTSFPLLQSFVSRRPMSCDVDVQAKSFLEAYLKGPTSKQMPKDFNILLNRCAKFSSLCQNFYLYFKRYLCARCTISQ